MAALTRISYNGLLLTCLSLSALGCASEAPEPPAGATEESAPPAVELGAPTDPQGAPTPSPEGTGTP